MSDLSKLSHVDLLNAHERKPTYAQYNEIIARMSSPEPDWQPIETAPKDGLGMLMGPDWSLDMAEFVKWENGLWVSVNDGGGWYETAGFLFLVLRAPRPKGPQ